MVFGGFDQAVGRAANNTFSGNTLYQSNTLGASGQGTFFSGGGIGEIWVQWSENNLVENNIVVAGPENVLIGSFEPGSSVNHFDYNLYSSANVTQASLSLNNQFFVGLLAWGRRNEPRPEYFGC